MTGYTADFPVEERPAATHKPMPAPKHIHLVLPGLAWPDAKAVSITQEVPLPALAQLLRFAHISHTDDNGFESWLARQFGLLEQQTPFAALRRNGEDDRLSNGDGYWLCADPVSLYFAQEQLLLSTADTLDITPDETASLIGCLNDFFLHEEGSFIRFESCSPTHWYLRLRTPAEALFSSLDDVVGRPVAHFLPQGTQARQWQRIGNEIQMLFHNHPVNTAREAQGKPAINSLWLWGQGDKLSSIRLAPPAQTILAHDTLTRGLALASGISPADPEVFAAIPTQDDSFIVLDTLHRASLQQDAVTWRNQLQELETRCFAPLLNALKKRQLATLRISAPADHHTATLLIQPRDLWKFWRKTSTLSRLTPVDTTQTSRVSP